MCRLIVYFIVLSKDSQLVDDGLCTVGERSLVDVVGGVVKYKKDAVCIIVLINIHSWRHLRQHTSAVSSTQTTALGVYYITPTHHSLTSPPMRVAR